MIKINNKAFTLVELLVVIIILSLLGLISSIAITKILKDSKEDLYQTQILAIKSAAETWGSSNMDKLPNEGECKYLTLKDLKETGLLDSSVIDSRNSKEISDDLKIKITSKLSKFDTLVTEYEVDSKNIEGCDNAYITPVRCFGYSDKEDGTIEITEYRCGNGNYGGSPYIQGDGSYLDVVIPPTIDGKSVTSIGDEAFIDNQLTSVVIPDSVTSIGGWAFYSNQLTSIIIPDSVTSIGGGAFYSNQLTSVVIPDSVTSIGYVAFNSNKLTSVVIPDSVINIEYGAFNNNKLSDSEAFIYKRLDSNKDGVAEIDNTTIVSYGGAKRDNVMIPNNVKSIGEEAFYNNQLTSIIIPDSVTSIENDAFGSNQLTSVIIPNSVTSIGYAAFGYNQLTSVVIPNSVTSIGYDAFTDNQLTSVIIKGKSSSSDFEHYGGNCFGWSPGYNDSNIKWES